MYPITNILLDVLDGTIVALNPVTSTGVVLLVVKVVVNGVLTTCRILPVLLRIGFPATVVIAFVLMVLIILYYRPSCTTIYRDRDTIIYRDWSNTHFIIICGDDIICGNRWNVTEEWFCG